MNNFDLFHSGDVSARFERSEHHDTILGQQSFMIKKPPGSRSPLPVKLAGFDTAQWLPTRNLTVQWYSLSWQKVVNVCFERCIQFSSNSITLMETEKEVLLLHLCRRHETNFAFHLCVKCYSILHFKSLSNAKPNTQLYLVKYIPYVLSLVALDAHACLLAAERISCMRSYLLEWTGNKCVRIMRRRGR